MVSPTAYADCLFFCLAILVCTLVALHEQCTGEFIVFVFFFWTCVCVIVIAAEIRGWTRAPEPCCACKLPAADIPEPTCI